MEKLIYKDKAGNQLYKKYIKTRKTWQYFGKNAEGQIVDTKSVNTLLKKAKIKINWLQTRRKIYPMFGLHTR